MAKVSVLKYISKWGLKYDSRFKIYRAIREKKLKKGIQYTIVKVDRYRIDENLDPTQFEV